MPKAKAPEIYVARSTGIVKVNGETYTYFAGRTRLRAGHPLLKAHPEKFQPLDLDYDIEDATATPGRKRGA